MISFPAVFRSMISLARSVPCCPRVRVPRLSVARWCQTRSNMSDYTPLLDIVRLRQEQARRSILVQVAGHESATDLTSYCQENFGDVESLHYYKNSDNKSFTHFLIVQFRAADSVQSVMSSAQQAGGDGSVAAVPVCSPFLWLQGASESAGQQKPAKTRAAQGGGNVPFDYGRRDKESLEQMVSCRSVCGELTRCSLGARHVGPLRANVPPLEVQRHDGHILTTQVRQTCLGL